MRSRVEIVADVTDDGRPVLVRLRADGALAVRATGPAQVHLVGSAAGPLNGDLAEVHVHVRAGARLTVRGVAATLALPARVEADAELRYDLVADDGAEVDLALPPLVVCRGARIRTTTRLTLAGAAQADLTEYVVLGRHGEDGGHWTGGLVVNRDGVAVLRTTQGSPTLAAGPLPVRAVVSRFVTAGLAGVPGPDAVGGAVRCPLASGDLLLTAIGADVPTVTADLEALRTVCRPVGKSEASGRR